MPEAGYEINKIYPPRVASSPTSGFVPAVICNEFVFIAGQMAHNPGTGLDPRVIVPEHAAWAGIPIRRQTEFLIVEKLKPALEAAGSSLEQSVKAQIYLADTADMSWTPKMRQVASVMGLFTSSGFFSQPHSGQSVSRLRFRQSILHQ